MKAVPIRSLLQMQRPSFPCFWRMHCYYPSWPHISQDSLQARKRRKKERKWCHRVAWIVTFAGLDGRNRDLRVKHLATQPGNAPMARPSNLTTAEGVTFEDRKGRVLRRMQTLRHSMYIHPVECYQMML